MPTFSGLGTTRRAPVRLNRANLTLPLSQDRHGVAEAVEAVSSVNRLTIASHD
jgi:hypothetical protein